jgi:hypothetical protein
MREYMARHFDISSAPEPVQVGVMTAMQGSATFNVANATGEPIRARARVCAEVPAESQWFQITDEAERLFNVNESQEFSVQITVPEDIQGDVFAFRLQVFSVEEPEEVYTDGERKTLNIIRIVILPFKLGSWWLIPAELAIALCVLWWHEVVSGMLAASLLSCCWQSAGGSSICTTSEKKNVRSLWPPLRRSPQNRYHLCKPGCGYCDGSLPSWGLCSAWPSCS